MGSVVSGAKSFFNFGADITGVINGSDASPGVIGEEKVSTILIGSAVSLTTATAANITSITLTAGDWDLSAGIVFTASGATATNIESSINTTKRDDYHCRSELGAASG